MTKHVKHIPKHRGTPPPSVPTKALRNTVVLSGIAATATGTVVAGGIVSSSPSSETVAQAAATPADLRGSILAGNLPARSEQVSRSDRREVVDPAKEAALAATDSASNGYTRTEDLSEADPRTLGKALLVQEGFGADQWSCLDALYNSESGWDVHADNPTSSAYGIPQALTQTHDLPAGYMTSAEVQIRWGLDYIRDSYGTPCGAWSFKQGHNWY